MTRPQTRCVAPSVPARLWVLALFAVAPQLPGYRGLRLPVLGLASALFAGCAWNTPPTTVHQAMTARSLPLDGCTVNEGAIDQPEVLRLTRFDLRVLDYAKAISDFIRRQLT